MAGIRLEWAQFGDFDSFDVIRSDTSMADVTDANLPSPIVSNLKTMYFVDTTVTPGNTYYYKVRAWRDGAGGVSGEVVIKPISTYRNNFTTMEGLEIYGPSSGVYIDNGLIIGATSAQSIVVKFINAPNLLNFEAQFDLTYFSASGSTTVLFAYRSHVWSNDAGKLGYFVGANHNYIYPLYGTNNTDESSEKNMNGTFNLPTGVVIGRKERIKLLVEGDLHSLYVNDVLKGTITNNIYMAEGGFGLRMWTDGNHSSKVENLTIKPL